MFHQRRAIATVVSTLLTAICLETGCTPADTYKRGEPPTVTVSIPIRRPVTNYNVYTGQTKAQETVSLRARVKGFLKEIHFDEKAPVKEGQLLFVIDEVPFKITLEMAQAKQAEAQAALEKAEQSKSREVATATLALDQAALGIARIDERRSKSLFERNAGTKEALDQSEATRRKAEAQVEADAAAADQSKADYQTNILSAKANVLAAISDVQNAQINLDYCRIKAPFNGRISRRLFDVGNLVGDGQATILATVYKDDPIYAFMYVSDTDMLRFRKMAREGKREDFQKGEEIHLDLGLANEKGFPHPGKLDYHDPAVDTTSGTVLARGVFANPSISTNPDHPDRIMFPGLFFRIRVAVEVMPNALLVPELSLGTDQFGRFLLIVNKDKKVDKRRVVIGAEEGSFRVVESGLQPDDLVIVNGLQKAREGLPVDPKRVDVTMPADATVAQFSNP